MNNYHFLNSNRKDPFKIPSEERIENFNEIYENFDNDLSKDQAARCLDCGVPYCKWSCPVTNHIPEWLKLIANGEIIKAAELSNATNSLPEICGRVCPQDRLCEGACTLNTGFGAVSIGNIEKYISDTAFAQGWQPKKASKWRTDKLVSIIGAGPAGLAAADFLTREGIPVKVYDKYPEIGGLLSYGIPNFKLEKKVILNRKKILENQGVEFILNTEIGKDIDFKELYEKSSAVFLGMGTYGAVTGSLLINGEALKSENDLKSDNIHLALNYLVERTSSVSLIGRQVSDFKNKDIIVLGGGDTAMDCCRTAIRERAKSVTCIYRRDFDNIPGSRKEIENAMEEGVKFIWNTQALEVEELDSKLHLKTIETELKKENGSKRLVPVLKTDSEKLISADKLIIAYGFNPNPPTWLEEYEVKTDSSGKILTKGSQTSNPKIFAGGDMVRGSDLVVRAVFDGREAAKEMMNYL